MRKITKIIAVGLVMFGLGGVIMSPVPAYAYDCNTLKGAANIAACGACQAEDGANWVPGGNPECVRPSGQGDLDSTIHTVINVMLFVIGILSVIMVIWGGISYVLSRGDPEKTKNAKNTIMYAIVGLIIAILAFAIVQWVFSQLS